MFSKIIYIKTNPLGLKVNLIYAYSSSSLTVLPFCDFFAPIIHNDEGAIKKFIIGQKTKVKGSNIGVHKCVLKVALSMKFRPLSPYIDRNILSSLILFFCLFIFMWGIYHYQT